MKNKRQGRVNDSNYGSTESHRQARTHGRLMTRTSRTAGNESGCRFSASFMDMMVKEMEGRLYDPEKNRRGRKIDSFKVSYYSHSVTFHPGNDSSCHRLSLPLYPADILILRDNDNGQKKTTTRSRRGSRMKGLFIGESLSICFRLCAILGKLNWSLKNLDPVTDDGGEYWIKQFGKVVGVFIFHSSTTFIDSITVSSYLVGRKLFFSFSSSSGTWQNNSGE